MNTTLSPDREPQSAESATGSDQNSQPGWPLPSEVPSNAGAVGRFYHPIKAALRHMNQCQYVEAANLLRCEFDKDTNKLELARIANMISPCGMIAEAIDALQRMEGGLEA